MVRQTLLLIVNTSTQKLFLGTENDFRANEHLMVTKSKDVDHEYFNKKIFLVNKNDFRANKHLMKQNPSTKIENYFQETNTIKFLTTIVSEIPK
jgi:hypothetical protein